MTPLGRRDLLKNAGLAGLSLFGGACAAHKSISAARSGRILAPVKVSPDRIIRTVAGLRPFRPSGFVVKTENLESKIIIHNYGHGGGGMTLSWGTSHLAVEEALKSGHTRYAVLGCGGVGLAAARLLQQRGFEVTIYARDLPPHTTSNISGAQWDPVSVYDHDRVTPQFREQFERAARLSYRYFQDLPGHDYGVRWMENYILSDRPIGDTYHGPQSPIRDLFPETRDLAPNEHPFHSRFVRRFDSMLIAPPIYLNAVLRDFQLAGGRIVVREFGDAKSIFTLPEPAIVNCTGLGAKALFDDDDLMPIKGQLSVLLPQPEVDYAIVKADADLYMFSRADGILLGGTHDRENWTLEPDPAAVERIIEGHRLIFQHTGGAWS